MIKNNRDVARNAAEIFERIQVGDIDKNHAKNALKALEVIQKSYMIDLIKDKQGISELPSEGDNKESKGMVRKIS
jgi:hypothetical protein